MIASLYICSKSFFHNGKDSDEDVYRKIFLLKELIDKVLSKYNEDNIFFVGKSTFLETPLLFDTTTVGDIVNRKRTINSDVLILLLKVFGKFKECNLDFNGLLEYLDLEDENNCNGIIVLNKIQDIAEHKQILTDYQSWLDFRRYFLGKYPKNADYFLCECKKYFEILILHSDNSKTLKEVLNTHSRQVVKCLSCLNDSLISELKTSTQNFPDFLSYFATKYKIDDASFEGRKDDKFNYNFKCTDGTIYNAYCEPHLKMYKDDSNNANQHCRIHFQKPENDKNVIYVGFIGKHL